MIFQYFHKHYVDNHKETNSNILNIPKHTSEMGSTTSSSLEKTLLKAGFTVKSKIETGKAHNDNMNKIHKIYEDNKGNKIEFSGLEHMGEPFDGNWKVKKGNISSGTFLVKKDKVNAIHTNAKYF